MPSPCPHLALQRLPENGHEAAFECVVCHAILANLRVPKPVVRDGSPTLTLEKEL